MSFSSKKIKEIEDKKAISLQSITTLVVFGGREDIIKGHQLRVLNTTTRTLSFCPCFITAPEIFGRTKGQIQNDYKNMDLFSENKAQSKELVSKSTSKGMTSLEVATLTGKQHAHIMRDIRNLLEQGVSQSNFGLSSYQQPQPKGGFKEVPCYNLTPKGCLILASGYDAVLREKIINRLEELEMQNRNGGFQVPQSFSEALMLAAKQQETIEEQKKQIEAAQPAVTFTQAVSGSASSCLVGELAKLIDQNGYPMGEKRLFKWLRENGYLGTNGERYNIPNQRYIEQGLFELKKGTRSGNNGVMYTTITPKVTGKGQIYFVNKFKVA